MVTIEQIAKTCHEVNRVFCKFLGDNTQPKWEDAPEWQKKSAINGVKYHLAHPDSNPSDSHNNWMAEKLKDGWKYGEIKNVETKEHHCLVPYEQLSQAEQTKDSLFITVVRSME